MATRRPARPDPHPRFLSRPRALPRPRFLSRPLLLLAHPLALACAALLAANELMFARLWPSWLTGKLGDFAWLGLVPLLLSAAAAPFIPAGARRDRAEAALFWSALALTGLGFALVKTLPAANLFAAGVFGWLLNAAPSITRDPTDLIALPALVLPACLFLRERREEPVSAAQPRRAVAALVALPLACLALIADAPAPNTGFTCLQIDGEAIYAAAGYESYVSNDGGLTWTFNQTGADLSCSTTVREGEWTEADGPTAQRRYRYQQGKEIQVSDDGGQSWQAGLALSTASEPEHFYLMKTRDGNPVYQPGPMDAAADPRSGNMLFAMGHEGVLVHTAAGEWVWSYGGAYRRVENFPDAAALTTLLGGEVFAALGLALLVFSSGALRHTLKPLRVIILGVAWLAWLAVDLIFPPATSTSYASFFTLAGLAVVILLALPLVIEQVVRLTRRAPRVILPLTGLALGAALLFILPYALWVYGALPTFNLATGATLIAAGAVTAAAVVAAGKA